MSRRTGKKESALVCRVTFGCAKDHNRLVRRGFSIRPEERACAGRVPFTSGSFCPRRPLTLPMNREPGTTLCGRTLHNSHQR